MKGGNCALNAKSDLATFGLLIDMIGIFILPASVISKVETELSRQYDAPQPGISVAADPYLGPNMNRISGLMNSL
jgi:hypothetical protein